MNSFTNDTPVLSIVFYIAAIFSSPLTAQDESRTWSDKSGRFSVKAILLERSETAVKLKKQDGRVISVAIDKLSPEDQAYLRDVADAENPFAGGESMEKNDSIKESDPSQKLSESPPADFDSSRIEELPVNGPKVFLNIEEPLGALTPDPSDTEVRIAPFGRVIGELDAYARNSAPILVNPNGPVFAVSTHRNSNAVSSDNFGRIHLLSKASRRPELVFESDETFLLLDHNVNQDRSVGVTSLTSPSERGGMLTLLDGLATGNPRVLKRWHLPEHDKPGFKPKVDFAKLIDDRRVIVQIGNQIFGWSLDTGDNWVIVDGAQTGKVALSPSAKYLALGKPSGVQIVDLASGEYLGNIPFKQHHTPNLSFSPNGDKLAMAIGNEVAVWNLQNAGSELSRTMEQTTGRLVGWVGQDYLLTQFSLIDLESGNMVWKYNLPSNGEVVFDGGYVAVEKGHPQTSLYALPMPHVPVDAIRKQLQSIPPAMVLVGRSTEVMLEIDSDAKGNVEEMELALASAIKSAGWKLSNKSDIKVSATITRGKKQKLNFRKIGIGALPFQSETITIRPYRASVSVTKNGKVLWQRNEQNMVPFIVHMSEGETLKSAVKKYEKIDPAYFERLVLPPRIFDPKIEKLVGRSRIKNGRWVDY